MKIAATGQRSSLTVTEPDPPRVHGLQAKRVGDLARQRRVCRAGIDEQIERQAALAILKMAQGRIDPKRSHPPPPPPLY